jgi:hypothetical protein
VKANSMPKGGVLNGKDNERRHQREKDERTEWQ